MGSGLQPDIAMTPDAQGRDVELGEAVRQIERERQSSRQPRKPIVFESTPLSNGRK